MEEPFNPKKASQMLDAFESLQPIEPSEAWTQSLMHRLGETTPNRANKTSILSYTAAVLLLIVINVFFVLNVLKNETPQYNNRTVALETISSELLMDSQLNNR